jgi:hypothetical protein
MADVDPDFTPHAAPELNVQGGSVALGILAGGAVPQVGSTTAAPAPPAIQTSFPRPARSLDADTAGELFGHYTDRGEANDILRSPPKAPAEAPTRGFGMNKSGLGYTGNDWQIGVVPAGETDNRYDTPEGRYRAERADQDKRDADRRGETMPRQSEDVSDFGQGAIKQVQAR